MGEWINCGSYFHEGFPGGSDVKETACDAEDSSLIHGLGRSPEKGNGNPLQYSCLGNSMDRGAWLATVCGLAKSQTRPHESLSSVFFSHSNSIIYFNRYFSIKLPHFFDLILFTSFR